MVSFTRLEDFLGSEAKGLWFLLVPTSWMASRPDTLAVKHLDSEIFSRAANFRLRHPKSPGKILGSYIGT